MKVAFLSLTLLVFTTWCEGATTGTTCQTSSTCTAGQCCRDSNNQVLGDMEGFGHFNPFGQHSGTGTCVSGKAQKGEVCDSTCQCDQGLECYRPVTGACCPPMTCMDADYVHKQREYWAHCFADPTCAIPP